MALIDIQSLSFTYPGIAEPVFENLDLRLDTNWRLGLIGRNGRGKTTLMRLLNGDLQGAGRISSPVVFHYFPPRAPDDSLSGARLLEALRPEAQLWQIEREASLIGLSEEALERPLSQLSGGERTKLLIAGLFLEAEEGFSLIDEPTNHLDAAGRARVAEYLRGKRGFVLSSHDRAFLDGCVDHILALNRTGEEIISGNFTTWAIGFEDRQNAEKARHDKLRKEISRLSASAQASASWSDRTEASKRGAGDKGYVGHKAAKLMKRAKSIERRRTQAAGEKSRLLKDYETADDLKMFPVKHASATLARAMDLWLAYPDGNPLGPYSFTLRSGDRLCLEGPNGSGKSTLLNALATGSVGRSGTLTLASGVRISCVSQDASGLRGSLSDIAGNKGLDRTRFLTVLRKLGFERHLFERDVSELSQGQKKKIALAASLCEEAHVYIWDEPLNYLDVYARVQIEETVKRFEPTMIFVEHDKAFQEAIATKRLQLCGAGAPNECAPRGNC